MSNLSVLYKAIKNLCPTSYKGSLGNFKENSEKAYAIYFKGGVPNSRRLEDGAYLIRSVPVVFNINSTVDAKGVYEGYDFCESVVKALESTFNYEYTDVDTGAKVKILKVETLGDVNPLGVNKFGINAFSLNFIIEYAGGN